MFHVSNAEYPLLLAGSVVPGFHPGLLTPPFPSTAQALQPPGGRQAEQPSSRPPAPPAGPLTSGRPPRRPPAGCGQRHASAAPYGGGGAPRGTAVEALGRRAGA